MSGTISEFELSAEDVSTRNWEGLVADMLLDTNSVGAPDSDSRLAVALGQDAYRATATGPQSCFSCGCSDGCGKG